LYIILNYGHKILKVEKDGTENYFLENFFNRLLKMMRLEI